MGQSSVIIHKGGREEKYAICIEDYVMSFLKEETGTLELSEFYFYGFRENVSKGYIIYGAARDRNLAVFNKLNLLDEIGCRLTQAGPVFFVREENSIYEIKGYDVFFQDNKEMQSYLIDRKRDNTLTDPSDRSEGMDQSIYADKFSSQNIPQSKTPHSAISVQLGIILVALVAIVINSTNSYDKMNQLNQSASEVLFAIENQEADAAAGADNGRTEIMVERSTEQDDVQPDGADSDSGQAEDVLKLVTLENEVHAESVQEEEGIAEEGDSDIEESAQQENTVEEPEVSGAASQEQNGDESSNEQDGVEALSRNVARYYEVEKGDTLYTISQKIYGDTTYVQRICELNEISNPDRIRYGQKIILP